MTLFKRTQDQIRRKLAHCYHITPDVAGRAVVNDANCGGLVKVKDLRRQVFRCALDQLAGRAPATQRGASALSGNLEQAEVRDLDLSVCAD